jgi:hypothetical protein
MANHTPSFIQRTSGDEERMGCVVATLIHEHSAFDLSYDPSGLIVIAVAPTDEAELYQIIKTTI